MIEIQTLLEGEESWRTGALDNAISQILVDLKPHDYEAWKWRFEDTFHIELDTVLKVLLSPTADISGSVVNLYKRPFFCCSLCLCSSWGWVSCSRWPS